jgi:poly(3-hydroxybutyrate) depolymerase
VYTSSHHPPTPGITDSLISGTFGTWTALHKFAVDYWSDVWRRGATPLDVAGDFVTWVSAMADRQRPPWAHENTILREWPIARLRDFSAADAPADVVPTVILPPQAGHDSSIVDFAEGQSQVLTGRDNGCSRILVLEWVGATQETKDTSIDDYMALLREVTDLLGGKINVIGDCQGGWMATIFAATHPERVNALAIAGAPIDFHAGEPLIHDWLKFLTPSGELSYYRSVVEANGGVLPGRFLLDGFKMLQPDQELSRRLELATHLRDPEHVERYRKFEDWFQWTQALPGAFYLWVVEHLFMKNSLIKRELVVEGKNVDLANISCPLFLMAGQADHITPADQVWALADHVTTPVDRIGRQSSTSGHLGLFMGREALEDHWKIIFAEMGALSTPTVEDDPNVLTDEPTHKRPTRRGPRKATVKTGAPTSSTAPKTAAKGSTARSTAAKAPASKATAAATDSAANATTAKTTAAKAAAASTPSGKLTGATSTPDGATAAQPAAAKTPTAKPVADQAPVLPEPPEPAISPAAAAEATRAVRETSAANGSKRPGDAAPGAVTTADPKTRDS